MSQRKPKKDFDKAAPRSAVDQVMAVILKGDGENPAPALVAQAAKEGLARRFSFYISEANEDIGNKTPYNARHIAVIYPTERDDTFKVPATIRPMLPEAYGVDSCVVTDWHLPKKFSTPAKMAQLLADRGFVWDQKVQRRLDSKMHGDIKAALEKKSSKAPEKNKKGYSKGYSDDLRPSRRPGGRGGCWGTGRGGMGW